MGVWVCVKGGMQRMVWIKPDKCQSMLHMETQVQLQGVLQCELGRPSECGGWTGINPGCSRIKELCQDSAGERRKEVRYKMMRKQKVKSLQQDRAPSRLAIQ